MIIYMIDSAGRARIGRFVRDEIARRGTTPEEVGAKPGRPSLVTIKRIKAGDPSVSELMFLALGTKLELPADYLMYIGTGDLRRIKRSGAAPDLIRVTLELFRDDNDDTMHLEGLE